MQLPVVVQSIISLLALVTFTTAQVPEGMIGTWGGQMLASPFGPGTSYENMSVVVERDGEGGFYIFHPETQQLMMTRDGLMQYCFGQLFFEGSPLPGLGGGVVAPFEFAANTSSEVVFQWRGPGTPIHPEDCVGITCARYTLALTERGTLRSTLTMPTGVTHMDLELHRQGPPDMTELMVPSPCEQWVDQSNPRSEQIYQGPVFGRGNNRQGEPADVSLTDEGNSSTGRLTHPCPFFRSSSSVVTRSSQVAQAAAGADIGRCVRLNEAMDVRIEYTPATLPCMPCDVTYKFSANMEGNVPAGPGRNYIAVGFRDDFQSYMPVEIIKKVPQYFGMTTTHDEGFKAPLSGHIVLGYPASGDDEGCVRDMESLDFVGKPTDRPGPSPLRNSTVEHVNGRTEITFVVNMNFAEEEKSLDALNIFGNFYDPHWMGIWRIMWAVGSVGNGGCDAEIEYHSNRRGMSPLFWPTNVWCPRDDE